MSTARRHFPAWFRLNADVRVALVAAFLTAGLHAVWWLSWPSAEASVSAPPRPTGPDLWYLDAPQARRFDAKGSVPLDAISPTLFSIPNSKGFSRSLLEEALIAVPPLESAIDPLDSGDALVRVPDRPFQAAAMSPSTSILWTTVLPAPGSVFPPTAPATNAELVLVWQDGLSRFPPGRITVEPGSPWDDDKPWEATLYLELEPGGWIRHLFIEKSTSARKKNTDIARAVRAMRLPAIPEATSGRLTIRYGGRPPTPTGVASP